MESADFTISSANKGFCYDPNKPMVASQFPNMWRLDEAHTHSLCSADQNAWYAPAGSEVMTTGLGYAINTTNLVQ